MDQRPARLEQKLRTSRKTGFGLMYHGDKPGHRTPRPDRYKSHRRQYPLIPAGKVV